MTFDTTTNIAILNFDKNGYDLSTSNSIKVYFNQPMYELFNSFPCQINSLLNATMAKMF